MKKYRVIISRTNGRDVIWSKTYNDPEKAKKAEAFLKTGIIAEGFVEKIDCFDIPSEELEDSQISLF